MTTYVHAGGASPHGPPVTFLHGAGMDHTVWRFQTRWLAHHGRRVLAPDLPGHGASAGEPLGSVEEWAGWLERFLQDHAAAGTVVGHSLGALVALETAVRRPDLVQRLVMVGAGARMPVHPVLLSSASDDLPRAARFIAGWSFPAAHLGGHPEAGTWERGAVVRLVERSRPGALAADLRASGAYDATSRLGEIRAEVLVVSGQNDRMVPSQAARALVGGLPGARHQVLEGAGHQPMIQRPREFNRLLADFVGDDGKGSSR